MRLKCKYIYIYIYIHILSNQRGLLGLIIKKGKSRKNKIQNMGLGGLPRLAGTYPI